MTKSVNTSLVLGTLLFAFAITLPAHAQKNSRKYELQPISPKFSTLIPPNAKLENIESLADAVRGFQ